MGAACVLTVTASIEILNLEAPSVVDGHQGATVQELVEEDLAEGCPWMCNPLLPTLPEPTVEDISDLP